MFSWRRFRGDASARWPRLEASRRAAKCPATATEAKNALVFWCALIYATLPAERLASRRVGSRVGGGRASERATTGANVSLEPSGQKVRNAGSINNLSPADFERKGGSQVLAVVSRVSKLPGRAAAELRARAKRGPNWKWRRARVALASSAFVGAKIMA